MYRKLVAEIKSERIKGSTLICVKAVDTFKQYADELIAAKRPVGALLKELQHARQAIIDARPDEPALRNALRFALDIRKVRRLSSEQIIEHIDGRCAEILDYLAITRKKIAQFGAKKIKKGMVVFTHSHSTTVIDILLEAHQQGKRFEVVVVETRPHMLGKVTAQELAKDGIIVHYMVDAAVRLAMKKADIALIGADAIDHELGVYNKIGAEMIAEIAHRYHVPLYVCTDSLKYEQEATYKHKDVIEQRDPNEVWENAPKNIHIENFAYERVSPKLFAGIICEMGILKLIDFKKMVSKTYPEWFG